MTEPLTPDRLGAVRERQGERSRSFAHRPCWADVEVLLGEVDRLRAALAAGEAENARFEGWLHEADAAMRDHLRKAGRPMPRGSNWLEALWEMPAELARLRGDA